MVAHDAIGGAADEPNNVDSSRSTSYFVDWLHLAPRVGHADPAASCLQRIAIYPSCYRGMHIAI